MRAAYAEQSSVCGQERGFKWKSLSWLRNPCLLKYTFGAFCLGAVQNPAHEYQQQVNLWSFWKEARAHLTQTFVSTYGT